ncbi:MAG: site-specific integrase [Candidatus Melainabacteria bacterium]|nr:site-specific integrase [Candidatus Melainabacteria bacterium]
MSSVPSLSQALSDYCNFKGKLKPRTKKLYQLTVRRCLPDWLYLPVTEIDKDMVRKRHAELSKIDSIKGTGEAQANFCFRVLRAVFAFAEDQYHTADGAPIVPSNPVTVLSRRHLWNKNVRRQERIAPDELPRWFAAVLALESDIERDYLLCLLLSGMRRNELGRVKFNDIDLSRGTITLTDTKSNRPQVFPASDVIWALLRRRLELANYSADSYVFSSPAGGPLSATTRCYERVAKVTGIKWTPHTCRRTFASTAAELGSHVYIIQKLLNHAADTSTWTHGYFVSDLEDLRRNVQLITDRILQQAGISKTDLVKQITK